MNQIKSNCFIIFIIIFFFILNVDGIQGNYDHVVFADEILDKISRGEPVVYSNVVIKGDLNIDYTNLSTKKIDRDNQDINTYGVKNKIKLVLSSINIMKSRIEGRILFSNAGFAQPIYFTSNEFAQVVDFSGSIFSEVAFFGNNRFLNHASFDVCRFEDNAIFSSSEFVGNSYFRRCIFKNYGGFFNSNFNGDAYFLNSKFLKSAEFRNSNFKNYAYFWSTYFGNSANFWRNKFMNSAYFEGSQFDGDARFSDTQFNEYAYFGNAIFNIEVTFNNSQIMKDAYFDGTFFNKKSTFFLSRAKINKLYLRWINISCIGYDDEAYLFLIKNYKSLGWFDDSNNCYYDYRTRHPMNFIDNPIQYVYDRAELISYGYGVKPERPLILSIISILLFGIIFYFFRDTNRSAKQSDRSQEISIWEAIHLSASAFTSGASAFVSSPIEIVPKGKSRYLITLERFLGWIFFTLFIITLANTAVH